MFHLTEIKRLSYLHNFESLQESRKLLDSPNLLVAKTKANFFCGNQFVCKLETPPSRNGVEAWVIIGVLVQIQTMNLTQNALTDRLTD